MANYFACIFAHIARKLFYDSSQGWTSILYPPSSIQGKTRCIPCASARNSVFCLIPDTDPRGSSTLPTSARRRFMERSSGRSPHGHESLDRKPQQDCRRGVVVVGDANMFSRKTRITLSDNSFGKKSWVPQVVVCREIVRPNVAEPYHLGGPQP